MLENARQYLARKAQKLDLSRGQALAEIQKLLDSRYPGMTHAKSINEGVLKVQVESSAVASELRLNQVDIIKQANVCQTHVIERIYIQTGAFN